VNSGYQEEKLTLLISVLFNWLEESQPASLYYGEVCLRGAMERYFYFEAITQPSKLLPLLDVTKNWRSKNQSPDLSEFYDSFYLVASQRGFIRKIQDSISPWLRILGDFVLHLRSRLRFDSKSNLTREGGKRVGFFAVNERFIHYFRELGEQFDQEQKIFFLSRKSSKVKGDENIFSSEKKVKVSFKFIPISPKHKLFPIYFRICFFFLRIKEVLKYWQPEVLLFAEGTSHYDALAAQAAQSLNIPTIRIQSGRAGILHSGYQNMPFDLMLCWGKGFIERYKITSPKPEYLTCRSPLISTVRKANAIKTTEKNTVVIFSQPISKHISQEKYMDLVQLTEKLAKHSNNINVIVRMHPADNAKKFYTVANNFKDRVKIMNSPHYSLAEVMAESQCAVGFFSTTLSEAAACGVIPIILKSSNSHSVFPFPEEYGAAIVVNSLTAAVENIHRIMMSPDGFFELRENMRRFSVHFFGEQYNNSTREVTDVVRAVVNKELIHGE